MSREETLEKLIYELQVLRAAAENIQQRIGLINATIAEAQLAIATLDGVSTEEVGSSLLVPIGGGSYIRAKLDNSEKLIVGIGADIAVEKTLAETKEDFQSRVLELEKARTSLTQKLDDVSTNISGIQREAQKMAQLRRGEAKNV